MIEKRESRGLAGQPLLLLPLHTRNVHVYTHLWLTSSSLTLNTRSLTCTHMCACVAHLLCGRLPVLAAAGQLPLHLPQPPHGLRPVVVVWLFVCGGVCVGEWGMRERGSSAISSSPPDRKSFPIHTTQSNNYQRTSPASLPNTPLPILSFPSLHPSNSAPGSLRLPRLPPGLHHRLPHCLVPPTTLASFGGGGGEGDAVYPLCKGEGAERLGGVLLLVDEWDRGWLSEEKRVMQHQMHDRWCIPNNHPVPPSQPTKQAHAHTRTGSGETWTIMRALLSGPKASCSRYVSFELRNGMWPPLPPLALESDLLPCSLPSCVFEFWEGGGWVV